MTPRSAAMIGATYKLTPNLTFYGDFAEANRTPTPLELACADPFRPCLIDNSLVGDPNLQQVVSYTFEAGLRGAGGCLTTSSWLSTVRGRAGYALDRFLIY